MNQTQNEFIPSPLIENSVAAILECAPSEIAWDRFPNSYANYVHRAKAGQNSVIVKSSDNQATINDWNIPNEHLWNEYNFLKSLESNGFTEVQFPRGIRFLEEDNAIVMTDLGKGKWLLQRGLPRFQSRRRLFAMLGRNLAGIHNFAYPDSLVSSLHGSHIPDGVIEFKLGPHLFDDVDYLRDFHSSGPCGITLMDFGPRNILRTRPIGLIDFDFLSFGYQYFDVAHFLHFVLWVAIARNSKRLALSLGAFLEAYCMNRNGSVVPDQLMNDSHFLTWLYSLCYRKYTRKPNRPHEQQMREYLIRRSKARSSSWQEFVERFFVCRRWLR